MIGWLPGLNALQWHHVSVMTFQITKTWTICSTSCSCEQKNPQSSAQLGLDSIWRCYLTSIENPIVEIRWSYDRLISTMGFPILVRKHLYIESGPWTFMNGINRWLGDSMWSDAEKRFYAISYLVDHGAEHQHSGSLDRIRCACTWSPSF